MAARQNAAWQLRAALSERMAMPRHCLSLLKQRPARSPASRTGSAWGTFPFLDCDSPLVVEAWHREQARDLRGRPQPGYRRVPARRVRRYRLRPPLAQRASPKPCSRTARRTAHASCRDCPSATCRRRDESRRRAGLPVACGVAELGHELAAGSTGGDEFAAFSGCSRRPVACCSRRVILWSQVPMPAGAPKPDSRHAWWGREGAWPSARWVSRGRPAPPLPAAGDDDGAGGQGALTAENGTADAGDGRGARISPIVGR